MLEKALFSIFSYYSVILKFSLHTYRHHKLKTIMSASNDLGQWYKSIPKITRAWFTGSIIVPVAARLGLVRPQNLVLFMTPIIKHFQVCFIFHLYILFVCLIDMAITHRCTLLSDGF